MHQSLWSSLRVCCPTSRAFLSPTSPPPCRLVYCTWVCVCLKSKHTGCHFLHQRVLRVDCSFSVGHWQNSGAAYEMVKWASLPCGTFLLQTPTIDLFCLLIFIASQDGATALPVSCISYSLSFSPWLSFALPHPWTLFLCLIYESTHSISLPPLSLISLLLSVTFHLSLSDVVSLVSRCCVYLMVDLSKCDGSFLSSVCERLYLSVYFVSCLPPREENVQTILSAVAVSILCLIASMSVVALPFEDLKSEHWWWFLMASIHTGVWLVLFFWNCCFAIQKITYRYTYTVDVLIVINGQVTIILLNDLWFICG